MAKPENGKPKPKPKRKNPFVTRRRKHKKKPARKMTNKGEYPIKRIVNKATTSSRIQYNIDWDIPKGAKKNWIDYSNLLLSLPNLKQFDIGFSNSARLYFQFAMEYITKISEKDLQEQRAYLESVQCVSRIVAYMPDMESLLIYWENGCISKVNLTTVTDVLLKRAIGAMLVKENKWIIESYVEAAFDKKFSLYDDEEDPEDSVTPATDENDFPEDFDWQAYYEFVFDHFPRFVHCHWILRRSPLFGAVIINPFFPADDDDTGREPHLTVVSHTMCSNCGRLFDSPEVDLILHILHTNHIGWYVACLVEIGELENIKTATSKVIKQLETIQQNKDAKIESDVTHKRDNAIARLLAKKSTAERNPKKLAQIAIVQKIRSFKTSKKASYSLTNPVSLKHKTNTKIKTASTYSECGKFKIPAPVLKKRNNFKKC